MILLKAIFIYLFIIFQPLEFVHPVARFLVTLLFAPQLLCLVAPLNTTHQILFHTGNKLHHRCSKLPQVFFYDEK